MTVALALGLLVTVGPVLALWVMQARMPRQRRSRLYELVVLIEADTTAYTAAMRRVSQAANDAAGAMRRFQEAWRQQ